MTPRPAATLIVLRSGGKAPELLMLRRPARGFFGGMWVFPGGTLESIDGSELARQAIVASEEADDLPWRAAALRETVEETGLAVTEPPTREPIEAVGADVYQAVLARKARLDGSRLRLVSQWVTPRGFPKRFDARFYLTCLEESPRLSPSPSEVVELTWVTPGDALHRVESGDWPMARPTLHHLRWLASFSDTDEIWAAAAAATAERVEPMIEADGSEVRVRLPAAADLP